MLQVLKQLILLVVVACCYNNSNGNVVLNLGTFHNFDWKVAESVTVIHCSFIFIFFLAKSGIENTWKSLYHGVDAPPCMDQHNSTYIQQ